MSPSSALHFLVACESCGRQFDAAGLPAKARFHCSCGKTVEVPRFRVQDAAVVRCSSCSAPRTRGALSCQHCGADYTLHEQDLHTICPKCMTRVSDRSRYCHHCATPIVPQGAVGKKSAYHCPVCGSEHQLSSRELGAPKVTIFECSRCAGVWLGQAIFELLAERARTEKLAADWLAQAADESRPERPTAGTQALYRRCPECASHMNRRNFGTRSGVIIDACRDHGIWFDNQELDAILRWIRHGGEERVAKREADDERHRNRQRRLTVDSQHRMDPYTNRDSVFGGTDQWDLVGDLIGSLFDL